MDGESWDSELQNWPILTTDRDYVPIEKRRAANKEKEKDDDSSVGEQTPRIVEILETPFYFDGKEIRKKCDRATGSQMPLPPAPPCPGADYLPREGDLGSATEPQHQ